ncbi:MAG: ABC transporter ATP-binding protein [Candidatus Rokubacteria bacterium]|nr:ABC transporter ATP-binding protein [Candidatus Rokubacteria bacterium]
MTRLLETRAVSKRFGGLEAVSAVDFRVDRGEVRALIGPNGAGKTTLVGLISGRLDPTAGRVFFRERDVTRLRAWDRVGLGIVYTFQVTSLYRRLSVRDNVALAVQRRRLRRLLDWIALDRDGLARDVEAALARVGLGDLGDQPAGALAYGHQRVLEVAMALALEPDLLILDEPTQGLAAGEIDALCRLVRDVAGTATVLLIEHNLGVVLELASRVTVMDQGRIIAEGTPREIEAHPEVQRVYLGR